MRQLLNAILGEYTVDKEAVTAVITEFCTQNEDILPAGAVLALQKIIDADNMLLELHPRFNDEDAHTDAALHAICLTTPLRDELQENLAAAGWTMLHAKDCCPCILPHSAMDTLMKNERFRKAVRGSAEFDIQTQYNALAHAAAMAAKAA